MFRLEHIQRQWFEIALGKARHAAGLPVLIVDLAFQAADQHIADHLAFFVGEVRRLGKAYWIQLFQQAREAAGMAIMGSSRQEQAMLEVRRKHPQHLGHVAVFPEIGRHQVVGFIDNQQIPG
ncbi:hypothetical protein D9M68_921350 [compost metagenome]